MGFSESPSPPHSLSKKRLTGWRKCGHASIARPGLIPWTCWLGRANSPESIVFRYLKLPLSRHGKGSGGAPARLMQGRSGYRTGWLDSRRGCSTTSSSTSWHTSKNRTTHLPSGRLSTGTRWRNVLAAFSSPNKMASGKDRTRTGSCAILMGYRDDPDCAAIRQRALRARRSRRQIPPLRPPRHKGQHDQDRLVSVGRPAPGCLR